MRNDNLFTVIVFEDYRDRPANYVIQSVAAIAFINYCRAIRVAAAMAMSEKIVYVTYVGSSRLECHAGSLLAYEIATFDDVVQA